MKRVPLSLFTFLFLLSGLCAAPTKTVWQIGEKNHSASELALSPDKYKEFLANDFGWEDRFYIIGLSSPQKDFPYVLPGPADHWGGTSYTAGIRTHVLNILFGMKEVPETDSWKLIIDLLDTHHELPALFKITINGKSWKYALPKGSGKSIDGDYSQIKPHTIEIPLNSGVIRKGSNSIALTSLEGSWILFDDIRLMGPDNAELNEVNKSVYLRDVKAADFQTTSPVAQPLLVDIEHLSGHPLLEVKVDGKKILEQRLEKGRYILEAPMPVVKSPKTSHYIISADGAILDKGMIRRAPHNTITLADYIDTRMGTAHSRWMIAPGPWMPFSMVKLSPDNQDSGWQSGYDPSFESIGTFSHIHEWTMAGLGIMPANGPLKTEIGSQSSLVKDANSYRSAIDKTSEETKVGYYKVDLTDYQIKAELTATSRCGFQRYTYPQDKDARVMIDLKIPSEYDYQIVEGSVKQTGARRIEGFSKQLSKNVWSADADQNYTIYFVIEFNKDIKKFGGWHDHTLWETDTMTAHYPQRFGCYAEFDTTDHPEVMVRSGISYVDMAGASNNLSNEITEPFGWNFEAVHKHQSDSWNNILNRVRIYSNDYREKVRFYTNLYRAFCRNTFSDADRRWVDAAGNIQKLDDPDAVALGCDAFWNTFWNLNQVWNLIAPEWSSRWVKSQLAMYDANGWLAKGPSGMKYIPVMVGEHEIPLLVSTYQMGIRNYDAEKMFRAIVKMQTTPAQRVANGFAGNRDLETYLQHQYVPADKGRFSNTLEYSYDDWTVSQLAKALGKEEYYRTFSNRGNWWKNAINPATGYAQMRYSNGEWEKNFDPFKSGANHHYVEGNAWQLTFLYLRTFPHSPKLSVKSLFIDRLSWGFKASEPWRYNAPGDQYWDFPVVQGNQQSMHFAFLFNWAGQPWQTQRWSRSIIDRYYGFDTSNAYLGDEDQGQMSAWFVMAALGLFQTDGGCNAEPVYELGSPLFEKIKIDLGKHFGRGKQFIIKASNTSRENKYIQSAKLNGKKLNSFKFPAKELLKGGTLELEMGDRPNKNWGIK
ncbi:GH92 family glycosyl hydrolase [Bacteroides thetaiotaomicron]|nr:GH92 family glycosyl hydrolase [Bacteroides thetaiotaomicron]